MKPISIICILCGTFVFVAPMLYQVGSLALCAYALANTHLSPMDITAPTLEAGYRLGSMCFGLSLAVVGLVFALLDRRAAASGVLRQDAASPLGWPGNA